MYIMQVMDDLLQMVYYGSKTLRGPIPWLNKHLWMCTQESSITVDWEIFAVKIFSDSIASPKIKHVKTVRIISDSVVRVVCPKII